MIQRDGGSTPRGTAVTCFEEEKTYVTKEIVNDFFQECCSNFLRTCEADTEESVSDRDEFVVKLVLPICELKVGEVITATLFCET